mgnify:FL=1|jgi:hypothetical protein
MNINDFKLESEELRALSMFYGQGSEWLPLPDMTEHGRECIDMLVLSGLLERKGKPGAWLDEWRLTPAGFNVINLAGFGEVSSDTRDRPVC